MVKEACWTISNITAGNKDQIQCVIDAQIFPTLFQVFNNSPEDDIKTEAMFAILNALTGGSTEQILYLVSAGCISPLCNALSSKRDAIVLEALQSLEKVVQAADQKRFILDMLEEAQGLDKIDKL
eukprot:CAMPEP_0168543342 /NCGR_PEP_ID=MMETSP0413-20121227/1832_1 /TAXON_ID=136452 /ORGANISM="Filamoeba nolandi, Strain NC-AS-23-1" /LENGTH=124 /DNA_ID=CAMNT_0008573283 /DNA_START=212 /DNA_END=582 /DNA_ORIENTATION=-